MSRVNQKKNVSVTALVLFVVGFSFPTAGGAQVPISWEQVGANVITGSVVGLSTGPAGLFAATSTAIFRSTNGGTDWSNVVARNGGYTVVAQQPDSPNVFAGSSAGLTRSTDGGTTWQNVTLPPLPDLNEAQPSLIGLATKGGGVVLISSSNAPALFPGSRDNHPPLGAMLRSTDNGNTWTRLMGTGGAHIVRPFATGAANTVYAGSDIGVFRSADNGQTWIYGVNGLLDLRVRSLAVSPGGDVFLGQPAPASNSDPVYFEGGVARSANGGLSWTEMGLERTAINAIVINAANHVFVGLGGGNSGGVRRSTDNGATFGGVNTGLTSVVGPGPTTPAVPAVNALAIGSTGTMYAGTAVGVFRTRS